MSDQPDEPSAPPPDTNVVPIDRGARTRKRKPDPRPAPGLPIKTGVRTFGLPGQPDGLLLNLRESCLTDETIDGARLTRVEGNTWRQYGFRKGGGHMPGVLIPFFEPGNETPIGYRLRPGKPITVGMRNGKPVQKKYDQPPDTGQLVYLPPLAACSAERLRDPRVSLYWVEGEKKALLLAQLGLCVVGLTGVWNWGDVEARAAGEGRKLDPFIVKHAEIAGRSHVICFDADTRTKPEVMQALQKLAGVLEAAGAASVHMCLPPDGSDAKGIDDYAGRFGLDACGALLANLREPVDAIAADQGCISLARFGDVFSGSGVERLLRMPQSYEADRNGRLWVVEGHDPDDRKLVLDAPMVIARELTDAYTQEVRHELRFRLPNGMWRSVIVPRESTGDRAILNALRPYGAQIDSSNLGPAVVWLSAFERDNGELMPRSRCVSAAGWHEGQFVLDEPIVPKSDAAAPLVLDVHPEQRRVFAALQPRNGGSLEGHCAALRAAWAASSDCALAISAAVLAPLLRPLGIPNFAVHLCGESSRGKTTMLRIAASVFGDPSAASWVASWNSTIVGLEQRAAMLNDLPQFYDEAGSADAEHVERAVYMLCNGEGRQRSTKDLRMRATQSWRTVVVSTGERDLAPETSATGAQVRVVSVPIQGFGELGAVEINALLARAVEHYGALGRAIVRLLVELDDADRIELRAAFEFYLTRLRAVAAGNPLAGRIAAYFAGMQVVEDLLHEHFGIGAEAGATIGAVFAARCADRASMPESLTDRVVNALREWVAAEPKAFPAASDASDKLPLVHGYQRGHEVCFLPGSLRAHLAARALPWTVALRRDLNARGVLARDGEGSFSQIVRTGGSFGALRRLVVVRLEGVDGFQNPLPVTNPIPNK
jgi:hypothetical protein